MRGILIIIAVTMVFSAAVYAANPRLRSHQLKQWVSVEDVRAEIEFGREVAARIIGRYSLYENDELTRYVNLLGKSLAQYSNRPEIDFVVGVLDTDVINAYAAPGGYIFISKGALAIMEDEAELVSVLAHEIIHISQQHIVNELDIKASDDSAVSGLGRLVGGVTDAFKVAFVQAVDKAEKMLFEVGYKRKDELEADSLGIILASSLNYDPEALIRYFRKIEKKQGDETSQFKKLHPSFGERIDRIKKLINEAGLSGGNYKTGKERFNAHTS